MLNPVVISPPFGNFLSVNGATSIAGSYTVEPRPGAFMRALKTVRPIKNGWVNRMGLRNPGIYNVKFDIDKIYSIVALNEGDYDVFLDVIPDTSIVEINLSCPNIHSRPMLGDFQQYVNTFPVTIVKLPPPCVDHAYRWAQRCYKMGVRFFHVCNTIPTADGGESGARLRIQSLKMISWMRTFMPDDVRIIAGGGIYEPHHIDVYKDAGADLFSISTACFRPWRIHKLIDKATRVV